MNGNIINVTALNTVINAIFRAEEHLHDIQVAGEISGYRISGGHAYFTLKDENCQIEATCFNCAKTYIPKDGESVIAKGSVDYYAKGGKLKFKVDAITPIGQGLLAIQLEILKRRLEKEGYFDQSHKKPIPPYPANVCVITSFSGAVIRDIKKTIRLKNDIINIYIKDVRVQGEGSHKDIIKALEQVDELGYDVLIIARGGGSAEDLMPFNNEELVKAIYECKTPIISAVGHETDYTLCDEVADYRAATPTAAAEYIAYDTYQLKRYFADVLLKTRKLVNKQVEEIEGDLQRKLKFVNYQMNLSYANNSHALEQRMKALSGAMDKAYTNTRHSLENIIMKLQANNPLAILGKGYWRMSKDGTAVSTAAALKKGDSVTLQTSDGIAQAEILEVKNEI
ncbi:MAG: exodeoxyribonuclease VII large subunit [Clostridia bacterium]|nr:exodeoxyribonuclease VII large subunit [Clostridia bacterium]MDE7328680.1 exodeoxyribonuclease VII large subunit [Clostridia bacterium]